MKSLPLLILVAWSCIAQAVQIEKNVAVPMRDGVVLRANVFRPEGEGPWPVLVLRTPYDKDGQKGDPYA
ncbi:MAG: CocE/NonD family hydrolase, partial [Prosthecobacter sp.]